MTGSLWGVGQARSILPIKPCSVNTPSLKQGFCTGGDAIVCAPALSSTWHFSTVGRDCSQLLFNLLPIFIRTAGSGFPEFTIACHLPPAS